jgi:transcriptional regulator with XRE-family HTH domain
MTISRRVFEKMKEIGLSQKEFSEKTGIPQSTISEWKSKKTNPTSEKIMIICKTLGVTPEWLLSGSENTGTRGNKLDWYVIDRNSEQGVLIETYNNMDHDQRMRLAGFLSAICSLYDENGKS